MALRCFYWPSVGCVCSLCARLVCKHGAGGERSGQVYSLEEKRTSGGGEGVGEEEEEEMKGWGGRGNFFIILLTPVGETAPRSPTPWSGGRVEVEKFFFFFHSFWPSLYCVSPLLSLTRSLAHSHAPLASQSVGRQPCESVVSLFCAQPNKGSL